MTRDIGNRHIPTAQHLDDVLIRTSAGAREMDVWAKCLPCKLMDPSFDPQHPHKS